MRINLDLEGYGLQHLAYPLELRSGWEGGAQVFYNISGRNGVPVTTAGSRDLLIN